MSVTLTSEDGKENEHDGIEEAKAHGQGVLVDDGRDDEHGEHGSCSEFPLRQLQGSEQEQRGFGSKFRGQAGSLGNLCHQNYRMSVKLQYRLQGKKTHQGHHSIVLSSMLS